MIRNCPVIRAVCLQIGVQKEHRYSSSGRALLIIDPGADPDISILDLDCCLCRPSHQEMGGIPRHRKLNLFSSFTKLLAEVSKSADEGYCDQG